MDFNEKFLYHIWDAQHLDKKLQTITKKVVKVIYPGRFNTDSGPDFKNAVLEIDGKKYKGDIEIELKTYNWKNHEHNEDPHFNEIILHVVYEHNASVPFTIKQNGQRAEILEIKDQLDKDIAKLIQKYADQHYAEKDKKCELFSKLEPEQTIQTLTDASLQRFENKIKRFKAEHYFADYDQLLYQGMMEALGYSKNKFQMLKFSNDYSYQFLKAKFQKNLLPEDMIKILLQKSNLIDHLPPSFPLNFKHKWIENEPDEQKNDYHWKLFRIRPSNHPVQRIIQFSEFLYSSLQTSLLHKILQLFSFQIKHFKLSIFKKNLYSTFRQRSQILPQKYLIGKTRIDTILINIILPVTALYAKEKNYQELEKLVFHIYENYPSLAENFVTKHMKTFLNDEQKKMIVKKEIFQQGLLNIYYSHCREHLCSDCVNSYSNMKFTN